MGDPIPVAGGSIGMRFGSLSQSLLKNSMSTAALRSSKLRIPCCLGWLAVGPKGKPSMVGLTEGELVGAQIGVAGVWGPPMWCLVLGEGGGGSHAHLCGVLRALGTCTARQAAATGGFALFVSRSLHAMLSFPERFFQGFPEGS